MLGEEDDASELRVGRQSYARSAGIPYASRAPAANLPIDNF